MIEASTIVATVAQRFSMQLQRHREATPLPFYNASTLRPEGGVWARLRERAVMSSADAQG
jgi:hypothetical protein